MNTQERLQLDKMIKENNVKDFTNDIRKKKHSHPLEEDLNTFLEFNKSNIKLNINNPAEFERILISKCQFLFINYTDIFNRLRKDELDVDIFKQFISILRRIEDSEFGQHDASFEVGKLLKKIYIDSALRKAGKLDNGEEPTKTTSPKNISWREYKEKNL
jgi:hypothetical protein